MTPGYKTTEFWLSLLVALLGALMASGAIADGSLWATLVGGAIAALGSLGYSAARGKIKAADAQREGIVELARARVVNDNAPNPSTPRSEAA